MTDDIQEIGPVLPRINAPKHVAELSQEEMVQLAADLRAKIIETVSKTGGHLAPSLGVTELTIALMHVFDLEKDKIVWDVGHQAYAHKLLTGRRDEFHTLRTMGGVSGFPKIGENPYDHFGVGHSSTSISAALGMAMARDLAGKDNKVVAVIGDGSMTAGLAFEGLNQAGHMDRDCIVVLNDNEMSISRNVGALSSFLSRKLSNRWLVRIKKETESVFNNIPGFGPDIVDYLRKSEGSFKGFFTPGGMLFEALRFNYMGPIDGHNLEQLVGVFQQVKNLEGPKLVHVITKKGKGYEPAEQNPTYFHGVGCFEPETGLAKKFATGDVVIPSYTEVFGDTLCELATKDERIVAITAAMPEGTGLTKFAEKFPDRFVDVGICEQHAVTFAAGLATQGFRPVVVIYSTFLQRSYDQILHDVCLQNLPVTFCLDRGGLVGEDGATHHGVFDLSFLRHIPNLTLMAPKDEGELQNVLKTAIESGGPAALRYPRGCGVGASRQNTAETINTIPPGTGEMVREGKDALVLTVGSRVFPCLEAANELQEETGNDVAVFNTRFIKPLPEKQIAELVEQYDRIMLLEENALAGGFGSAVLEYLTDSGLILTGKIKKIKRLGIPDEFVEHGAQKLLRKKLGINKDGIKKALGELLKD